MLESSPKFKAGRACLEKGGYCGEDAYTASWSQLVSPVAEPSVDL